MEYTIYTSSHRYEGQTGDLWLVRVGRPLQITQPARCIRPASSQHDATKPPRRTLLAALPEAAPGRAESAASGRGAQWQPEAHHWQAPGGSVFLLAGGKRSWPQWQGAARWPSPGVRARRRAGSFPGPAGSESNLKPEPGTQCQPRHCQVRSA